VQIFIFHNESGFYQRLSANASDTSVVIDNIAKDITYSARILARNHAGFGVFSDVVLVGKAQDFSCFRPHCLLTVHGKKRKGKEMKIFI